MFRFADRFPLAPSTAAGGTSPVPWGTSRLEPFGFVEVVEDTAIGLDPNTQRGLYQLPGGVISMSPGRHSKSRMGTEKGTKTSGQDNQKRTKDTDHTQDTKID